MEEQINILEGKEINFHLHHIDSDRLKSVLSSYEGIKVPPDAKNDLSSFIGFWFLTKGINGISPVSFLNDRVTIQLEKGKSTHTFENLQATLRFLSNFINRPLRTKAIITRQSDGFSRPRKVTLYFKPKDGKTYID